MNYSHSYAGSHWGKIVGCTLPSYSHSYMLRYYGSGQMPSQAEPKHTDLIEERDHFSQMQMHWGVLDPALMGTGVSHWDLFTGDLHWRLGSCTSVHWGQGSCAARLGCFGVLHWDRLRFLAGVNSLSWEAATLPRTLSDTLFDQGLVYLTSLCRYDYVSQGCGKSTALWKIHSPE